MKGGWRQWIRRVIISLPGVRRLYSTFRMSRRSPVTTDDSDVVGRQEDVEEQHAAETLRHFLEEERRRERSIRN
jgi:hypothetical protein